MLFSKMAIAVTCIIFGFSIGLTSLVLFDKPTLHNKREILIFFFGVILFIAGIILLHDA